MQPQTSTIYLKQGQQLQREGRLAEAEVAYGQAITLNPIFYGSFQYLGEVLALQEKLDEAVEVYQRAKELNPKALWVHQRLGEVLLQQNKLDEAIACFQTALEINPDFSWAYKGLGDCWSLREKGKEAIAAYQKAVELNPSSQTFRQKLEQVVAEQNHPSEEQISETVEDCLELDKAQIEEQAIEEAITEWRRNAELNLQINNNSFLTSLEPISTFHIYPESLRLTSGKLIENGNKNQLVSLTGNQGLVSFGPYVPIPDGLYRIRLDWELLETLENNSEPETPEIVFRFDVVSEGATVVWYNSTVNIKERHFEFFLEIVGVDNAEVRFFANGIAFAVNFIEFILLYQPTPSYYLTLGRIFQSIGRINQAVIAYKKSFSNIQKFCSLKELGDFLNHTGYQEEAAIVYFKIVNSNDSNLEEKIEACYSALKIKPEWLEITAKLSELLKNQGQLESAIKNFQQQLEKSPNWVEGYLKLAELYEEIGSTETAIHYYQKILDINFDYPEVYARIGKLERKQGKYKRDRNREPFPDHELKLTVVIPTFNRSTRLQQSLENNLKTDRSDIEFLIIDNNSTDNTAEVVQNFMLNDKRIRYTRNVTNIGPGRNLFVGLVNSKAPLVMCLADDDYVTAGFVDLVIWIFETHPTVGGIFNMCQENSRKSMFSANPQGGLLAQKGLEAANIAIWSGTACGISFRQSYVDYHQFKLDASIIPQQWFSLNLAMQHDVYGLFSQTEYTQINRYINTTTSDGQVGGLNLLYRVQNGFMPWDVGAYEMTDFHLYRSVKLGLKDPIGRPADHWILSHFRIWLMDSDPEGSSVLISRVIRNPYIRYSIIFWNSLIKIVFSEEVSLPIPNKFCMVLLGCFMLVWRLIIQLREYTDPQLADIYYVGAWPRKDTYEPKHSKLEWEAEGSANIGYSASTVIKDLRVEIEP